MSTVTDSKSGSTSYSVDKLTETNYRSWASQLHWILDEKEAWDIVKGTEKAPIRPTGTTESPATAEAITEYDKKALDFTKRSNARWMPRFVCEVKRMYSDYGGGCL